MVQNISVVIPAYNAETFLTQCLAALRAGNDAPAEIIVVDDGSTDGSVAVAEKFGASVMTTGGRRGPALARNLGAEAAQAPIVFFVDADVCVHYDTISRLAASFSQDLSIDAIIGSYDFEPQERDFVSQYRNLMHSFVHQTGSERASTFWSGCGAIKRDVFLDHSGFNVAEYGRPAIEDIELGYRLMKSNCKIMLDHELLVKHLKKWTFWNLLKTDIMDRGIPWTQLILRDKSMPNDLNIQLSQRVSVALVFALIGLAAVTAILSGGLVLIPFLFIVFLMLARWWGEVGSYRRPRRALAKLTLMIIVVAAIAYYRKLYGLIPFLAVTPIFLLLRHRYDKRDQLKRSHRVLGMLFICCSVIVAIMYLPYHHLMLLFFLIIVVLAFLNSEFYLFLAGKRGISFMLAAIPFHLLYHFYSGVSFIIGFLTHHLSPAERTAADAKGDNGK